MVMISIRMGGKLGRGRMAIAATRVRTLPPAVGGRNRGGAGAESLDRVPGRSSATFDRGGPRADSRSGAPGRSVYGVRLKVTPTNPPAANRSTVGIAASAVP